MFKRKRLWIIPLIVALVAVTGVFAAPASMPGADEADVALAAAPKQPEKHCIHANQEQLSKMKKLWGQDIKLVEFLKQVLPEVLKDVPQDIMEPYSIVKMMWPPVQRGLQVADLSDIDISWGLIDKAKVSLFWVHLDSNSGQIEPYILSDFLHVKKYKPSGEPGYNQATIIKDETGRPIDVQVIGVTPEAEQAREENSVAEEFSLPQEGALMPELLGTQISHTWALQQPWFPNTGWTLTKSKQGWEWDGEHVIDAWDDGSINIWSAHWEKTDDGYDSHPDTPCLYHMIDIWGTFRIVYLHIWEHSNLARTYAHWDGDSGHDFSYSGSPFYVYIHRNWYPK